MKLNTRLVRRTRSRNDHDQSAWHKVFDAVLEPRTFNVENDIIEYLHYHRHDLPRAIWIER